MARARFIYAADATPEAPLSRIRLTAAQARLLCEAVGYDGKMPLVNASELRPSDALIDFGLVIGGNLPRSQGSYPYIQAQGRGIRLVRSYNAGRPRGSRA